MIILTTDLDIKSINVIPRSEVFDSFHLRDESNNTTVEYPIDSIVVNEYYTTLFIDFTDPNKQLEENKFYNLALYNGSELVPIFRDRVFCTNQAVFTFSSNIVGGIYRYNGIETPNEYITYGQ
jgi:hypothetical protein